MTKARVTKYIRRWKGKSGEWEYEYKKNQEIKSGWLNSFLSFFKFKDKIQVDEKIKNDYNQYEIKQKFNISLDSWKDHIAEYFKNKDKWQSFFNKEKKETKSITDTKKEKKSTGIKKEKKKPIIKLSVMKFIHSIYGIPSQIEVIKEKQKTKEYYNKISDKGLHKNLKDKSIEQIQKIIVEIRDAEEKARREGVNTTRGKITDQGWVLNRLLFSLDNAIKIKKEKEIENNFKTMPENESIEQQKVETLKQKEIDQKTVKAIETVTPENRSEKEAEIMGEQKEPWAISFEKYKQSLMKYRNLEIIKKLNIYIDSTKRTIERIKKGEVKDPSGNFLKSQENNLLKYKNTLNSYEKGEIDEKFKETPAWDYIQKQYDSIKDKNSIEAKFLKRKLNIKENKAKKEHERLVDNAIKDGKQIPADVLKEYPDLSKKFVKEIKISDINYKPEIIKRDFNLGINAEKINISIQDYTKTKAKDIYLVDEDLILDVPRPSYIPELDVDFFAGYKGRKQTFDVVRLASNKYILVNKEYQTESYKRLGHKIYKEETKIEETEKEKIEKSNYFMMNAETLAATWDYYQKLYIAKELKKYEEEQDREEKKYYEMKKTYEEKGKIWPYAPFKRTGKRILKKSPDSNEMDYRTGFMISDFLGIKNSEGKGLTIKDLPKSGTEATPEKFIVFNSYENMLKELSFKINDMKIQKKYNDESDTYKKGEETAYGNIGLKNDLKKTHGVKVKKQNGTEINEQEITKIGMVMDDIFSVFGNRKEMSEKYGLKISYAGEKHMHASKAIGLFIPDYKVIAISDFSIEKRGFTFAHEFSHFMDNYLGDKEGYFFSSDRDGSIANTIAKEFRSNLKIIEEKGISKEYINRTCECFARAMEQYYSIKKGEQEILYKEMNKNNIYVEHNKFMEKIMPLCEKFLIENDKLLKAFFNNSKKISLLKKYNEKTDKYNYIKKIS